MNRKTIWGLVALAGVIRTVFFCFSENAGGDAGARLWHLYEWSKHPIWMPSRIWLPLPFYAMGSALWIWNNPWVAPRLVNLVLGTLSVAPFYLLTRLWFTETIAKVSAIVFCLYGLHIGYCATTSSEPMYLLAVLWALVWVSHYGEAEDHKSLVAAAVAMNLASWIRFDAWMLMAALGVALVFCRKWRAVILFGALCSIAPVAWMIMSQAQFGNPLISIRSADVNAAADAFYRSRGLIYRMSFWPSAIAMSLGPVVFVAGILGIAAAFVRRHALLLAGLFCFWLALIYYQLWRGGMITQARYTMFPGTLLIPFAVWVCHRWRTTVIVTSAAYLLGVLVMGESSMPLSEKFGSISPRAHYRPHLGDAVRYLNTQLAFGDKVLVDSYHYEESSLQTALRTPWEGVKIFWSANQELFPYLTDERPRFAIYAPEGALGSRLKLDTNVPAQTVEGVTFVKRFQTRKYVVYELKYDHV